MYELEVTTYLPNIIHPNMVANLPSIELESDSKRPVVPTSGKKPELLD